MSRYLYLCAAFVLVCVAACSSDTAPSRARPHRSHADTAGDVEEIATDATRGDGNASEANPGEPRPGDPKQGDGVPSGDPHQGDPNGGDPQAGDSRPGDSMLGDPMLGDPMLGDPMLGDSAASDPGPVDTGYDPEPLRTGPFTVLFDNSHGENAGNADWVIDDDYPSPSPTNPTSAEDWSGAYSSWGYDLYASGRYQVQTLGAGGRLTYNDGSNSQDLSHYDLLVLPEPNNPLSLADKTAILNFVEAGGGLFLVADHAGADRDGDGWDARLVLNDLMNNNDRTTNIFGIQFNSNTFTDHPITELANLPESRVLHGPFGEVTGLSIYAGTSMWLDANHVGVRGIIWRSNYPNDLRYANFATSRYGAGRIVAVGDSSPADDGTANPGNAEIYVSWNEVGVTNNILFLNACAWSVRDAGP